MDLKRVVNLGAKAGKAHAAKRHVGRWLWQGRHLGASRKALHELRKRVIVSSHMEPQPPRHEAQGAARDDLAIFKALVMPTPRPLDPAPAKAEELRELRLGERLRNLRLRLRLRCDLSPPLSKRGAPQEETVVKNVSASPRWLPSPVSVPGARQMVELVLSDFDRF